jgi:glycosyltransferase involved in cell wall biosynthesis
MTAKKKILLIMHLPPPLHGTSMMNAIVAENRYLKDTFDVRIVPIQFARNVSESGRFAISKIWKTVRLATDVLKEMVTFCPDVVYFTPGITGWAFYRDFILVVFVKLFPARLLLHLHGKGVSRACEHALIRRFYRSFFKGADVILLSNKMCDDIKCVCDSVPYILPNTVPDSSAAAESARRVCEPPVNILYLSNLTISKGIFEFLDALETLVVFGVSGFRASIIGQPNDVSASALQEELARRGLLENVRYLGAQYGKDKEASFLEAGLFVLPTKNDVFPLVILEAMQFGLPVVASELAAIPDMVQDGKTGYLVKLIRRRGENKEDTIVGRGAD